MGSPVLPSGKSKVSDASANGSGRTVPSRRTRPVSVKVAPSAASGGGTTAAGAGARVGRRKSSR
ncbi:MAG: hypothetical protein A2138_09365 [Deltaproteobacteria bacterium RBG_16_71_12]|nr:MAG: hypothetical protein A2138_09365 [Deltaproteobacteria bacterium RBG_16_71_12]